MVFAGLTFACVSAVRGVAAGLADALSASVPGHVAIGYLRNIFVQSETPRIGRGDGELIFLFALGDSDLGRGFALPANWQNRTLVRGLRLLIFRPGTAQPSSEVGTNVRIEQFPAKDASYREELQALDLEVRFQVVTPSDDIRRTTIAAVREGLAVLRKLAATAGSR